MRNKCETREVQYFVHLRTMLAVLAFIFGFFAVSANAHFLLNLNVRILHVEHHSEGFRVYLRTPMPYLVADRVGPVGANGLPEPAPFTSNALEDGKLTHFVDFVRFREDPLGLGALVEAGFRFEKERNLLSGTVEQVRIYRIGTQPDFATLNEARASFDGAVSLPDSDALLYVGDAVVDVVLQYDAGGPVHSYAVSSILNPGLPNQETTANLILDYGRGAPKVFRTRGLMQEPVEISRSTLLATRTFIWEGVRHILEGLDHVLFVVCLIIGASTLQKLLARVTGFTLGHSVTLAVGFFGVVPSGAWFVPAVEAGISLSIIYAAAIAIRPLTAIGVSERTTFIVTCLIGLLHGLGFSFVLQNILQVTSPNIWQSLLAFNIGVEVGQLAIVLVIWPMFHLMYRSNTKVWRFAQVGTATVCLVVAAYWTLERVGMVFGSIG